MAELHFHHRRAGRLLRVEEFVQRRLEIKTHQRAAASQLGGLAGADVKMPGAGAGFGQTNKGLFSAEEFLRGAFEIGSGAGELGGGGETTRRVASG
jgi:hypothetical protein